MTQFIDAVHADTHKWRFSEQCAPWFRGQSDASWPLIPSVLRVDIDEWAITDRFRKMAPMFGTSPSRDKKDEWLYLMQHVGAPTRLLDWTSGSLIALYFAVQGVEHAGTNAAVWCLHPLELNLAACGEPAFFEADSEEFKQRCDLAYPPEWEDGNGKVRLLYRRPEPVHHRSPDAPLPIAIIPTHVHRRMAVQKGYFTLHGTRSEDFETMLASQRSSFNRSSSNEDRGEFFVKYLIPADAARGILKHLRLLGIDHCTLFPDHDGLATELKRVFQEFGFAEPYR